MRIVSRSEWGAEPPRYEPARIKLPTSENVMHHFATNAWRGPAGMRACQEFHMRPTWEGGKGYNDIAYSFCVDLDGTIYEARGAGIQGAHTLGHNTTAHAICAMMDSDKTQPTKELIESWVALVRHGDGEGWWPDQMTHYHRQLVATGCPGQHLIAAFPDINALALLEDYMPLSQADLDAIAEAVRPVVRAEIKDLFSNDKRLRGDLREAVIAVLGTHEGVEERLTGIAAQGTLDAIEALRNPGG